MTNPTPTAKPTTAAQLLANLAFTRHEAAREARAYRNYARQQRTEYADPEYAATLRANAAALISETNRTYPRPDRLDRAARAATFRDDAERADASSRANYRLPKVSRYYAAQAARLHALAADLEATA